MASDLAGAQNVSIVHFRFGDEVYVGVLCRFLKYARWMRISSFEASLLGESVKGVHRRGGKGRCLRISCLLAL